MTHTRQTKDTSKLEEQKCTGNQGTAQNVQIREVFQIGEVSNKRGFTVLPTGFRRILGHFYY